MYKKMKIELTEKQNADILRIVKEWMTGCSCTETKPSDCEECTQGMVKALEGVLNV